MSQPLIDPWPGVKAVPLAVIARETGVTRESLRKIERQGLITPVGPTGRGAHTAVSHDDAMKLLAAILLGLAAGVALVTMFRLIVETGAEIGAGAITIPLPAA